MTSKIWIANATGHDFTAARKFGDELVPITQGRVNIFNVKAMVEEFKTIMEPYEKDDWLLLSGSSIINVIAAGIVLDRYGEVKFLIYDAANKSYIPREINMKQIKNEGGLIS